MSQVIRISASLYKRLENHVTGFDDSPAKIIERVLDFYEAGKGLVVNPPITIPNQPSPNSLEIIYYPDDEDSFKKDLLEKKCAYIKLHKTDGSTELKIWNALDFTVQSSVNGNLRSGYLRDWKKKGIYKAEVSTKNSFAQQVVQRHNMTTTRPSGSEATIESIVAEFKECGVLLSKMPGKKIIYDGKTRNNTPIVVAMPESKIYDRGNGWVDFTKIQIDIFKQYLIAIAVFRLSDGTTHKYDMNNLFPLLTPDNMMKNEKEGEHWKIDIWPNELVIRNGKQTLKAQPNQKQFINIIVNPNH